MLRENDKKQKYKLFIDHYEMTTNDYKVSERIIETNDIYHEIGRIYSTSMCVIKRIDYMKIDDNEDIVKLQEENNRLIETYRRTIKHLAKIGLVELSEWMKAQIGDCPTFVVEDK